MRHRYHSRKAFLGLAVLAMLATSGCTPPGVHRKVRGMIRNIIVQELGPADKYDVYTSRDSLSRLKAGRLSYVRVRGTNVRPAPGYVLDEVLLEGRGIKVDRRAGVVESAETAVLTGWVGEANLARMLADHGLVENPSVRILANGIEVRGTYDMVGGLPVDITASGPLTVTEPAGITFTADRITAGGLPLPIPLTRTIDFREIYEPMILTGIATEPGKVILTGTIDWTKFGKRQTGDG